MAGTSDRSFISALLSSGPMLALGSSSGDKKDVQSDSAKCVPSTEINSALGFGAKESLEVQCREQLP